MPEIDDMSELGPDPMDAAYLRAEQAMDDEAERAARRGRLLAAVAPAPEAPAPPAWRPIRRYGGWLAAACVAGLSAWTAQKVYRPAPPPAAMPPLVAPAATAPPAAPVQSPADKAPPAAPQASAAPVTARRPATVRVAPRNSPPPPADEPAAPPPLPIPPVERPIAPPPASAAAAKPADPGLNTVVVTGSRIQRRDDQSNSPVVTLNAQALARPSALPKGLDAADNLRAAAAAGRTPEIELLLARGVAIDAADENGETALMKSIEADRRDAAAVLRRHGANLDLKNRAGVSARDMAAGKDDAELDQALGLAR